MANHGEESRVLCIEVVCKDGDADLLIERARDYVSNEVTGESFDFSEEGWPGEVEFCEVWEDTSPSEEELQNLRAMAVLIAHPVIQAKLNVGQMALEAEGALRRARNAAQDDADAYDLGDILDALAAWRLASAEVTGEAAAEYRAEVDEEEEDEDAQEDPTEEELREWFLRDVLPGIQATYERDGRVDIPARREGWNNWIDALAKDGTVSEALASEACLPDDLEG